MATFERYFVEEKEPHTETKNSYYRLLDREDIINKILVEFGLDTKKSHIVNGHVPVELKKEIHRSSAAASCSLSTAVFPKHIRIRQALRVIRS